MANREILTGSHPAQMGASSSHGSDTAMQLQQQADENIKESGRKYLHTATRSGHKTVVKQLLKNRVPVNKRNEVYDTGLFYASESGHETVVKRLLDSGANVNIKDERGNTPLSYASQCGHQEVVKQLLGSGANVNIKDKMANTPLSYASQCGYEEVVKQLLDSGADVNIQNVLGDTPLSHASLCGHEEVVKQLLDSGADVNIQNVLGNTALSNASKFGYEEVVKQLLDSSADVDIQNVLGDTPLSYASLRGHGEVVKQLLNGVTDAKVLRQSHDVQGTLRADLERAIFPSEIGDAIEDAELEIGKEKLTQHANDHPNIGYVTTMERPAYFGLSNNTGSASMGKCQSDNQEFEEDDICTIMSENEELYMPQEPKETLVTALADALYHDIGPLSPLSHAVPTVFRSLPALLKEFATRLRHTANGKMHTEAISFVRQNRHYISASFRNVIESKSANQDELRPESRPLESLDMVSALQKVQGWNLESAAEPEPSSGQKFEEVERSPPLSNFSKHLQFLKTSRGYEWLLGKLHAVATLSLAHSDVIAHIHSSMNAAFDRINQSRLQDTAPVYASSFYVKLEMQHFLDHYYEDDPCRDIGTVITLTGSLIDAQAATCEQYMRQTWPVSGIATLRALENALANRLARPYTCMLSDNTQFECYIHDTDLFVNAISIQSALVEIGEQLAWLTAALKWSPSDKKMAYSTAHITVRDTSFKQLVGGELPRINMEIHSALEVLKEDEPRTIQDGCY